MALFPESKVIKCLISRSVCDENIKLKTNVMMVLTLYAMSVADLF